MTLEEIADYAIETWINFDDMTDDAWYTFDRSGPQVYQEADVQIQAMPERPDHWTLTIYPVQPSRQDPTLRVTNTKAVLYRQIMSQSWDQPVVRRTTIA